MTKRETRRREPEPDTIPVIVLGAPPPLGSPARNRLVAYLASLLDATSAPTR